MLKKVSSKLAIYTLASSLILITACGSDDPKEKEQVFDINKTQREGEKTLVVQMDGQIFSIPSPVQTAFLLKESGIAYDPTCLNSEDNVHNYSTIHSKAVNLGIYGADLGYNTIFESTEASLKYLKTIRTLAEDLGLVNVFSESLVRRFQDNLGVKDSMLVFVSEAYRAGDNYLKNNDKHNIVALVLAGGFIESLHHACKAAEASGDEKIIKRIGEQGNSLRSLISLMNPYRNTEEFDGLARNLEELHENYSGIESQYEYRPSSTDSLSKTTVINSVTTVNVSAESFQAICNMVYQIRNEIVG